MTKSGKMDYAEAKNELIQCGKGMVRRLADLDRWHRRNQEGLARKMVLAAQSVSQSQLRVVLQWRLVDAWLAEVMQPLQSQKRCLVVQGPSHTGKTQFVRSLFPSGTVLELNCANLNRICLDSFECDRHRAILWNEASASLVSSNRRVFKHPLCGVKLGHRKTGQHVRRYFLSHCCSIITTKKWHEDVRKLPACDQQWLLANTVVMDVERPLWESPDQIERCQQALRNSPIWRAGLICPSGQGEPFA